MMIGYARVSTEEQNLDLQRDALKEAGCESVFVDKVSGASIKRPGLARALRSAAAGDVLVVWKLDRLGRSLFDLVNFIEDLRARDIGLKVLTGQGAMMDTTRPEGRLIFGVFAALAEYERELISERTKAGIRAARRRGVHMGRPAKLTLHQIEHARALISSEQETRAGAAALLNVDVKTLRRALRQG